MLNRCSPFALERWYARYGFAARYNLSSSAAPPMSTAELLAYGGPAARDAYLELGLNYAPAQGSARLRQAIAAQYGTLGPEDVQVTSGAVEALLLVLEAVLCPGDACVVQTPMYPAVEELARACGAAVRRWPLGPDGCVDLDHLAELLAGARVLVLNVPHAPTGALLSDASLHAIVELARRHGVLLVVDEVYRGVSFDAPMPPAAADLGAVSIGDVAKPYGLGGLRIGWIATRREAIRRRVAELRDYTTLCASAPGEYLAALALEHRHAILRRHLATAGRNRARFSAALAGSSWLDWKLGPAGFTIFACSRLGRPTLDTARELAEQESVLVLPGDVYGVPGRLRIGFGVAGDEFDAGLERLIAYAGKQTAARDG